MGMVGLSGAQAHITEDCSVSAYKAPPRSQSLRPSPNYVMSPRTGKAHAFLFRSQLRDALREEERPIVSEQQKKKGERNKMLFRGGGGGAAGAAAAAGMNLVRYFSRKCAPDLRRINPKVPREEAKDISQSLYQIIKERGPLSVPNTWNHAKVSKPPT